MSGMRPASSRRTRRCLAIERLEERDAPAVFTWIGGAPGGNVWSNAANWKAVPPGGVPGPSDEVEFNSMATTDSFVDIAATNQVSELSLQPTFRRTLNIGKPFEITSHLTMSATTGTLVLNAAGLTSASTTFSRGTIRGGLLLVQSASTAPNVAGTMTWTGGRLTDSILVIHGAGTAGPSQLTINGVVDSTDSTINNDGTITFAGGRMTIGQLNNTGTFNISGDFAINRDLGAAAPSTFTNTGILSKTAGAGIATIRTQFHNAGFVNVNAGTLTLTRNGTHSGSFFVDAGATLDFAGTGLVATTNVLQPGVTFNGAGTVDVDVSGAISVAQGASVRVPVSFSYLAR